MKKHYHTVRVILGSSLLIFSAASFGADGERRGPRGLENIDLDGDGSISFEEFQASPMASIDRIDEDQNGLITVDEFINGNRPDRGRGRRGEGREPPFELTEEQQEAVAQRRAEMAQQMQEMATQRFQEADTDGDDALSEDEFVAGRFAQMDSNNDGVLSGRELRPRGPRGSRGHSGRRGQRQDNSQ